MLADQSSFEILTPLEPGTDNHFLVTAHDGTTVHGPVRVPAIVAPLIPPDPGPGRVIDGRIAVEIEQGVDLRTVLDDVEASIGPPTELEYVGLLFGPGLTGGVFARWHEVHVAQGDPQAAMIALDAHPSVVQAVPAIVEYETTEPALIPDPETTTARATLPATGTRLASLAGLALGLLLAGTVLRRRRI